MEHAEGETIAAILARQGPLSPARAVNVLVQLADAMDYAHARGVIHRDLKPENLVLTVDRGKSDLLKVLDLGIAKIVAPDYVESARLTADGDVIGSAPYMAPELFLGDPADARSDIYSIGCVAYALLTGAPPFDEQGPALVEAHRSRPPDPLSTRRPGVPLNLDELVLRCLQKDPPRRFQRAQDLARALSMG
jgi:serine/threonine-protein kinase